MSRSFKKYLASLLMFGSNGIVASAIALPSSEVVLTRTLLGALLLVAVLAVSCRRSGARLTSADHPRQALSLAVSGAALGISWIFLFAAYRLIGVGVATLAYYIGPVIVMALSPILFKESLTPVKLMGFAAVVAGAFLVVAQGGAGSINPAGLVLGGMAALMYAVMVIFSKRSSDVGGVEAATIQIVASFAAVAVYSVVTGQLPAVGELISADLPAVMTLGLGKTGLGG